MAKCRSCFPVKCPVQKKTEKYTDFSFEPDYKRSNPI